MSAYPALRRVERTLREAPLGGGGYSKSCRAYHENVAGSEIPRVQAVHEEVFPEPSVAEPRCGGRVDCLPGVPGEDEKLSIPRAGVLVADHTPVGAQLYFCDGTVAARVGIGQNQSINVRHGFDYPFVDCASDHCYYMRSLAY